jgi:hypothetical protein
MHRAGTFFFAGAGLLALALLPRPAAAAWPTGPTVNVPVCAATGSQYAPVSISDGEGGTIVAWEDYRGGSSDIYAQRISDDGVAQWTANGVALCAATGGQSTVAIASDSAGGAIVTWTDPRSGIDRIYAQRISAAGAVQWTANGVALCTGSAYQASATIVPDGAGGAIVAMGDMRSGNADIYAQRISAGGTILWTAAGVALCTATGHQIAQTAASDGAGGSIVTWYDERSGAGNSNIYAQRISAAGAVQWSANGVALCTASGVQNGPAIATDGAGGAIVTWVDYRNATNTDIYAQRVSAGGAVQWTANGVALCAATGSQWSPTIAADGAGGSIVTWYDERNVDYDLYAQKISGAGAVQWTADGVALCTATGYQSAPRIIPDGGAPGEAGSGAIVTWNDARSGNYDIYAQRISAGGMVQWTADGVALCTATGDQAAPTIVSDDGGGAIVGWSDSRNGTANYDIFAQRVLANGQLGGSVGVSAEPPLAFALEPVRPNPSRGGALTVRFTLPGAAAARVELLDVSGRRVAAREVGSLGAGRHALDLGEGQRLAPGLYLVRLRQGTNTRVARVAVLR